MGLNNVVKLLQESPLLSPSGQSLFLVIVVVVFFLFFFLGGGWEGAAKFSTFACVQARNFNITIVALSGSYKA